MYQLIYNKNYHLLKVTIIIIVFVGRHQRPAHSMIFKIYNKHSFE